MSEVCGNCGWAAHAAPHEIGARRAHAGAWSTPLFSPTSLVRRPVVMNLANRPGHGL